MIRKSLIDILLEQGAITAEQQKTFTEAATAASMNLDQYLAEKAEIPEEALAKAYAAKFEAPFLEAIPEKLTDPELLVKIPLKFLRDNAIIPIKLSEDENADFEKIQLVMANPFDFQPFDELSLMLGGTATLAVAPRTIVMGAINRFYPLEVSKEMIEELADEGIGQGVDFEAIEEEDILGMASEAPIIKLVNQILYQAVKRAASDIHIEPFEKELRVRYRIDGVLYTVMMPPKRAQGAIVSRVKIMAELNIAEKRQPQDGRIQIKVADKAIDIRVSILPVAYGERIVMRLLDKTKAFGAIDTIGLDERSFKAVENAISQPNGIVLITGPTGSGKTSTLYSILSQLNKPEVNIITVEDPVEYQMAGIGQVQVREKIGLTFAAALRSILRQDPDIVMIGETRDVETAQIAIQAALTGHLVLSTLHTNSAAAAITRLIDMGVEPFLIASTLTCVVAQRLVRRLCEKCRKQYTPDAVVLKRLNISPEAASKITFYEAVGCEECLNTGYRGRLAIFEVMVMSGPIAQLTMQRADAMVIQAEAQKEGMTLLLEDGVRKIEEGLTTVSEVLAAATSYADEGVSGEVAE